MKDIKELALKIAKEMNWPMDEMTLETFATRFLAIAPAPTFCERAVNLAIDTLEQFHKYGYDREQCFDALCDLRTLMTTHNVKVTGSAPTDLQDGEKA